ncbi:MAG: protein-export chaperone SecB [Oleibacter sp.]|nr:protein-export chaperone SecB [Thalassolituus sp.]
MAETDTPQAQFALQRIYLKDVSYEAPNSPAAFTKAWKPEVKLDLNTTGRKVDEQHYEVAIKVTVTAKNEGETAFLVELVQCGLFVAINIPEQQLAQMLGAMCPNILFPYLRENIDNLVVKGGFPALMLSPINFDALYQQRLQEAQAAQKDAESQATH